MKKITTIRIDDRLREALIEIANNENRSLSNLIETILNEYMSKDE